jgi:hypothetical protein
VTIELEIKSADAAEVKGGGVIAVDDDRTFTIIGSVTGIVDEVNDIVEPGAYAETLTRRTPKIIKDHQWSDRLGKTLAIEEYLPGDSRLPKQTADGKPWPREAGALVAKVRLFGSTAGKEAAERWREYGNEQQYSIGYAVPPGKATKDPKTGVRRIKSLDLFEISDVLWGAMPLAGPMPDAMATKMLPVIEAEAEGMAIEDDAEPVEPVEQAEDVETKDLEPLGEDVEAELPALVAEAVPAEVKVADVSALLSDLLGETVEVKYDTSPVGEPGGRANWVDKVGGLPPFIRAIAHALIRHGAAEDRAIATAVAACKKWAAGGGNVSAKTRAKAAAAIAEWERKKAASHAKSAEALVDAVEEPVEEPADTFYGWQPDMDAKNAPALESKGAPRLPGTLEERRDLIGAAVKARFDGDHSMIVGTAEDHVIASRVLVDDEGAPTGVESYRIGYTIRAGLVHLDEPEPVHLSLDAADGQVSPEDVHVADVVEDAVIAAKALLLPNVEGKAGRVLSGGNTERIKNAVQALISVLRAAGVDLTAQGGDAASEAPSAAPAAPSAAPTPAPVEAKGLDGLPNPHDLVASLRAAARGE